MKNNSKVILFYIVLIAVIFFAVFTMLGTSSDKKDVNFSEIMQYFDDDQVKRFEISNTDVITLEIYKTDKAGVLTPEDVATLPTEKISYRLRDLSIFMDAFSEKKAELKNLQYYDLEPLEQYPWWLSLLPNLLLIGAMVFFSIYMTRQMNKGAGGGMMNFGKAKAQTSSAQSTNSSSHG